MTTATIPAFLIAMSQQMKQQPSDHVWQVRSKVHVITERGYNPSHWSIVELDDGQTLFRSDKHDQFEALAAYLADTHEDWLVEFLEQEGRIDDSNLGPLLCEKLTGKLNIDGSFLPKNLRIFYMQAVDSVVATCLTQVEALNFIAQNKHLHSEPLYLHATPITGCPQMIELSNWILSLTDQPEETPWQGYLRLKNKK